MSFGAFISCNRLAGVGEFMTPKSGTPFDLCESINVKVAVYLRAIMFRGDNVPGGQAISFESQYNGGIYLCIHVLSGSPLSKPVP
jgi:hypothetical protein